MKVMSRKEQQIYSRLIKLAGGDVSLVEKAIRQSANKEGKAKLPEVMQSLRKNGRGLRTSAA